MSKSKGSKREQTDEHRGDCVPKVFSIDARIIQIFRGNREVSVTFCLSKDATGQGIGNIRTGEYGPVLLLPSRIPNFAPSEIVRDLS